MAHGRAVVYVGRCKLTLHNIVGSGASHASAGDDREGDLKRALGSVRRVDRGSQALDVVGQNAELAPVEDTDGAVVVEGVVGVDTRAAQREDRDGPGDLVPPAQVLGQVVGEVGVRGGVIAQPVV